MDPQEFTERLTSLPSREKIRLLRSGLNDFQERDKIAILLSILKGSPSSPIVTAAALKILAQTSYGKKEIFRLFLNDGSPVVGGAARKALHNLEEQEGKNRIFIESFLRKIRRTRNKDKRFKIIRAVSALKAPWTEMILVESLEDPCEWIRDYLVRHLSDRHELSLDLVYRRLSRPPWFAKSAALKILGLKKEPGAVRYIEPVLDDPNVEVRRIAAQALGEIGGERARSLLAKLIRDGNPYVKTSAREALLKTSNIKFC